MDIVQLIEDNWHHFGSKHNLAAHQLAKYYQDKPDQFKLELRVAAKSKTPEPSFHDHSRTQERINAISRAIASVKRYHAMGFDLDEI